MDYQPLTIDYLTATLYCHKNCYCHFETAALVKYDKVTHLL